MPWFSRKKWEQDASDELRFHIEQQTAANIAAGMPPEEARRQAEKTSIGSAMLSSSNAA